jgi:hypothetical protein
MAIFRASAELRDYASGGPPPTVRGLHAEAVRLITTGVHGEQGIDVSLLGRVAVVPVPGKKPRLIFHAARELNDALERRSRTIGGTGVSACPVLSP